jgi:hypothetical protein
MLVVFVSFNSNYEAFEPSFIQEQKALNEELFILQKELQNNNSNKTLIQRINVIKNKKKCEEF